MDESKNELLATAQIHSTILRNTFIGMGALTPTFIILYLMTFGGAALRFHDFAFHEAAIIVAVVTSGFIGWVAILNYRRSGEEYQWWVALAYIAFALIYVHHGIFTRLADTHLPAFLIFGPASRLAMGLYLMLAILRFDLKVERHRTLWPHIVGCLALVTVLGVAGLTGWISVPQVRGTEMASNAVFSLTVVAMLVKWRPEHLLKYHLVALFWFIQASVAFLLSKPWSHLWWSAHLFSALGFIILGYAIMRAQQATGAFAQVFSTAQLHHQLRQSAARLELEKEEQAALIERLQQTTERLKQSNLDLEQFAYIASHDLKAPLVTVAGFADILSMDCKGKVNSGTDAAIEYIGTAVRRMQSLINGLLAYSRATQQEHQPETVDLTSLLDETIMDLKSSITASGARIVYLDLPTVVADPTLLRSVFQNLISNAIKFCDESPPEVIISGQQEGDYWRLSVRDNGIGVAPDDAEKIFTMFHRQVKHSSYSGSGIGLATVERIVARHGGRIWVELPKEGRGTIFHFTLPVIASE